MSESVVSQIVQGEVESFFVNEKTRRKVDRKKKVDEESYLDAARARTIIYSAFIS